MLKDIPKSYIKYITNTIDQGLAKNVVKFRNQHLRKMANDPEYKKVRDEERKVMFLEANISKTGVLDLQEWEEFNQKEMEKAKELSGIEELPYPSRTVLKESWKAF